MEEAKQERIWFMDELRGFAVFCMVFYHAFFTFAVLFSSPLAQKLLNFFMPAEPYFAGLFILIAGISSCLSRSNLKRGLKLAVVALIITAVTAFMDMIIVFGILHFLSVCMILFGLLKKPLEKIPFWPGLAGCIVFYLLTMDIQRGIFAFRIHLPSSLYTTNWLCPFGIYSPTFASADYFPLLPWIFVYLAGTFLGRFAAAGRFPRFTYKKRIPFLVWFGRHALLLYVVHQPVIYGIGYLISRLF